MRRRLGIFGGAFDPPHHGHLIVASDAFEALDLDLLLFVTAADPPHKRGALAATARQRHAMIEMAAAGDQRFVADDIEIQRGGISYTVDTLRQLRDREPRSELFFLLGADQFRTFESWRDPLEVARLATLAVLARAGETREDTSPYGETWTPVTRVDISATEIRRRVALGLSIRYFVPEPVERIIERDGLYGNRKMR